MMLVLLGNFSNMRLGPQTFSMCVEWMEFWLLDGFGEYLGKRSSPGMSEGDPQGDMCGGTTRASPGWGKACSPPEEEIEATGSLAIYSLKPCMQLTSTYAFCTV